MLKRQTYQLNPQDVGQPKGIGISVLYNNGTIRRPSISWAYN